MRLVGLRLELGVKLHREKPRVIFDFDDLDQIAARVDSADDQTAALKLSDIRVVHFKTMPMALADAGGLVGFRRQRAGRERALVAAEPHGRALVDHALLLLHHVDDGMRRVDVKLGGVRTFQFKHVAAVFDHRDLEAEAETIVRDFVFAGVFRRRDFALGAAVAEAAGNEDAVETFQDGETVFLFEVLGVDAHDVDARVVRDARVGDRFIDGFIRVLKFDVFADDTDLHFMRGVFHAAHDLVPDVFLGGRILQSEQVDHEVVHAFFLQRERQLVDRIHVAALDHGLHRHVAEHGNLVAQTGLERMVATAHQDVGLDADLAQLRDGLLRGLGLQFTGRLQIRHQRHVDKNAVRRPDFEGELAHRFEERQAFDVTRGAADFGDEHIDVFAAGVDAFFDLVGHVRDHLHGLAEINAAALFRDHAFINLAGAQRVEFREFSAGETLVVAEVEVGLRAVFQHIDFAVLERAHRARIDVQVGVELLDAHGQPAQLQQRAQRSRRQAFAQRRDHSARHEDVFHR